MEPFAVRSDVEDIWRTLTVDEYPRVDAWIAEASQQVRDEVPAVRGLTVDERLLLPVGEPAALALATVRSVVARMVRRVLMNPDGARQRSVSIDDYTESTTVDSVLSSGEMVITAGEMRRLTGLRSQSSATAFMVTPGTPVFS